MLITNKMSTGDKNIICNDQIITNLRSVHNLIQFKYKPTESEDTKLVTIIGELHEHTFNCRSSSSSIIEYAKSRIQNNPNCILLLEAPCFFKHEQLSKVGSDAIREASTYFNQDDVTNGKLDNFDIRSIILKRRNQRDQDGLNTQNRLYYDFNKIYIDGLCSSLEGDNSNTACSTWAGAIIADYIEPYTEEEIKNVLNIQPNNPHKKEIEQLISIDELNIVKDKLYKIQNTKIQSIASIVKKNEGMPEITKEKLSKRKRQINEIKKTLEEIKDKLREIWATIVDIHLISKITSVNNTNEFIIVIGDWHRRNISEILKSKFTESFTVVSEKLGGNEDSCINTSELKTFCSS